MPCEECTNLIQWHHSIRSKMLFGGSILKFGVFTFLISIIVYVTSSSTVSSAGVVFGLVLVVVGFLITATQSSNVKVEAANET